MSATGLISISTIPQGAEITVDGKRFNKASPALIHDLAPGAHTVVINLNHHEPWQKSVLVEKAQATSLENILLIPTEWEKKAITTQPFTKLISNADNSYFLLTQGPYLKNLSIYRHKENIIEKLSNLTEPRKFIDKKPQLTFPPALEYSNQKLISLITMPKSPFILVHSENKKQSYYFWIDVYSGVNKAKDISSLFGPNPEYIQWDNDDKSSIFYLNQNQLNKLDILKNTLTMGLTETLKGYKLFNHQLFFISNDNQFKRLDYLHNKEEILTGNLGQLPLDFQQAHRFTIHVFSENFMIFLSDSGQLLSNKIPYELVQKDAIGFSKDMLDNQIIFWTKDKIGTIDFTKTSKEGVFETGPNTRTFAVKGKDIRQAFWVNKGSHILYVDQDQVRLLETSPFGDPLISNMVKVYGDVLYDDTSGKLFYLDQQTRQLMSLVVLPAHELISFQIPEEILRKETK